MSSQPQFTVEAPALTPRVVPEPPQTQRVAAPPAAVSAEPSTPPPSQQAPTTSPQASLGETTSDWSGLVIAALTLIIVLIVCYMCVQLFKARRPASPCSNGTGTGESFQGGWTQYRPTCSGQWLSDRRGSCKGLTTGDMPSIEEDLPVSWEPCGGTLGVPPPVYQ